MQKERFADVPASMIMQDEIPTDIQEKLAPYEGLTVEGLKGHKRLEDETYDDYVLRREIERQFITNYLQGVPVEKGVYPNRKQKKIMMKTYQKKIRFEKMQEQKALLKETRMCPKCKKRFSLVGFKEHYESHKR